MKWEQTLQIADYEIDLLVEIEGNPAIDVAFEIKDIGSASDTFLIRLMLQSAEQRKFYIENIRFAWLVPATEVHGLYFGGDPRAELGYLPFWTKTKDVATQTGLPYMALIHRNGENRSAFGLLDQITETTLQADLSEITRCYHMGIQKPASKDSNKQCIPAEGEWEEVFFISRSRNPWHQVLADYVKQVTTWMQQPLMPVPDHAYDPVFCTWTAIHHDVSHDWIMKNAPVAADLGFHTWLTDDGWFLEKGEFGNYEQVGEWLPYDSKFPDFKAHVAEVKALGFRYVLWVAPFMIGTSSYLAEQYRYLLTDGQEHNRFFNLSPWHSETKRIVTNLLKRLVVDYELDGFKIDFIDSISVHSKRLQGVGKQTLGQSVFDILQSAIEELLTINPEILIEFRNEYTNLASRRYANLYRSSDVPINFTLNRWQTVMLRLLVSDRAIHMDPMLWHPEDTDENVAVHLINGIASVPMVSIELNKYPKSHLDIIQYWIGFYNKHRKTIIYGEFRPQLHPTHIPLIDFVGENEVITGLYETTRVTRHNVDRQWVLNASTQSKIEFEGQISKPCKVIGRNKFGNIQYEQIFGQLPQTVEIEIGGSLEITNT